MRVFDGWLEPAGRHEACDEKDEAWVSNNLQGDLSDLARQHKASLIVLKRFRRLSLGTRNVSSEML